MFQFVKTETSFIKQCWPLLLYILYILFHFLKSPSFDPLKLILQSTMVMTCSPEKDSKILYQKDKIMKYI